MMLQVFPPLEALKPWALVYDLAVGVGIAFAVAAGLIVLASCWLAKHRRP